MLAIAMNHSQALQAPTADTTPFLTAADRIGRQLCRDAIWSGDRCNWLGWSMDLVGRSFVQAYRAAPAGLYSGVAGIALFLAHLERLTGDRQQREACNGALAQVLRMSRSLEGTSFTGFYTGLVGIGHTLLSIGELREDEQLIKAGLDLVMKSRGEEAQPGMVDLMSGGAGTIPVLIDVARRYHRTELLETACQQGEALLRHAMENDEGVSWPMPGSGDKNLLGYSHGTAGISCALLELNRVCPDHRFFAAAMGGLRYERTWYSPQHRNWPDFRRMPGAPEQPPQYPMAWCHGAPGIGISRLRMLRLLPDDLHLLQEVEASLGSVAAYVATPMVPGTGDFTLCHGLGGSIDFLLLLAEQMQRPALKHVAEQLGQLGLDVHQRSGLPWPCGVPGAGETPNLMMGTAGIGYLYLRLHDSRAVPSVLMVRPSLDG